MLITAHHLILRSEDLPHYLFLPVTIRTLERIADIKENGSFTVETDHIHDMADTFMATACGPDLRWLSQHCKHFNIDYINIAS